MLQKLNLKFMISLTVLIAIMRQKVKVLEQNITILHNLQFHDEKLLFKSVFLNVGYLQF